jgi:hypothetical protein
MTVTVTAGGEQAVSEVAAVVTYAPGVGGLQILLDEITPPAA